MKQDLRIGIIGGGPSGLFLFKQLIASGRTDFRVTVFEKKQQLGAGMPYSLDGSNMEHITNVSGNEIPDLYSSVEAWIKKVDRDTLNRFHIDPDHFNDYKVLPRLLFGMYLGDQFKQLQKKAREAGINAHTFFGTNVNDLIDQGASVTVDTDKGTFEFDRVIICTGHYWPKVHEGAVPGFFDSPYPPAKLELKLDHVVGIKGSSLTAIDAVRTLARCNGKFEETGDGKLKYTLNEESKGFEMLMHSRNGLLPAVRFHLEDSHLGKDAILSKAEIEQNRLENDGFLSLDYVFEKNFKEPIREKEPETYERINAMGMEAFVDMIMTMRENMEPFQLFQAEYIEAEKSIKKRESVYWKEMLGILSFAMNYPAKYFSAEDSLRLQKTLMPLISVVIAYVPQGSVVEMLALYEAGVLDMVTVGAESEVKPKEGSGAVYHYGDGQSVHFQTFIDATGQPHLDLEDVPFESLKKNKVLSRARLRFRDPATGKQLLEKKQEKAELGQDGNYYLLVPGVTINDSFQVVDDYGALNERLFFMSVPYIKGYNPDYSGLDFCEEASERIVNCLFHDRT
ncbi:MAG TPA: FAD/NAD(P)-binding protein [Mucilaginibacter sp.]|nr:FAD/NAD(P)-binding protein [Mucilaginibacter sp.]